MDNNIRLLNYFLANDRFVQHRLFLQASAVRQINLLLDLLLSSLQYQVVLLQIKYFIVQVINLLQFQHYFICVILNFNRYNFKHDLLSHCVAVRQLSLISSHLYCCLCLIR